MKCTIPEISWHNRDPVLSIDIQPKKQNANEDFLRLASGGTDSHVLIWRIKAAEDGSTTIEFASDLSRHQKAVNAVRFSPCGKFLASGDDESVILLWKQRDDSDAPDLFATGESNANSTESWINFKCLRGHLEDVYDLAWSPDSLYIISGSVDNTAIIWDVQKGVKLSILGDHKGFVQGVAWDPLGSCVATLSSDRKLRVFNASTRKIISRVGKGLLPVPKGHELEGKNINLFHDDTIQTFFRRLCFSPDGEMLIAPAGVIEAQEPGQKPSSTTLVFSRRLLSRPVMYLPSLDQYSVCVRCCPVLFELRNLDPSTKPESMFMLPYRVIFAVVTASAVVLYDTQQPMPFGYISNLHYTRLTDLTWSPNGDMLMVSSTDGYCSIITFSQDELGTVYTPKDAVSNPVPPSMEIDNQQESEVTISKEKDFPVSPSMEVDNQQESEVAVSKEKDLDSSINISNENSSKPEIVTEVKDTENLSETENVCSREIDNFNSGIESLDGTDLGCTTLEEEACKNQDSEKDSLCKDEISAKEEISVLGTPSKPDVKALICKSPDRNEKEVESSKIPSISVGTPNKCQDEISSQTTPSTSEFSELSIKDKISTPGENSGKKGRRVQLITLSSPKSKKKLL